MGLFRGDITLSHLGFDVGIKPEGLQLLAQPVDVDR